VVQIIRAKLAGASIGAGANEEDLAALQSFYAARTGAPLWITGMGFSAKGRGALSEIAKADEWGLDAAVFALPQADELPSNNEAQALAEIKLGLAILKYARFARGGRFKPSEISVVFDQTPPLRDPERVLSEIATASAPDLYLQSLHPKHEQFARLREALLEARAEAAEDGKPKLSDADIKRLVINMERWRWMPEDLGALYIWLNTPEFRLYVVKDGKTIFRDKTLVGTIGYFTPVFSADMKTIVFNPDWVAPETVLKEKLQPALRRKNYSILKKHKLLVSYGGRPVNVARIDWSRVNIHAFTFTQKGGPGNNLGKIKFLYPNEHDVYMHDTLPVRKKVFKEDKRAIGYGCVRMAQPRQFAEMLLAEDKQWPESKVKALWDKGVNSAVALDHEFPVHTTYFTAVIDDTGAISTFDDLYGLDHELAAALFGDAKGFPMPPPEPKQKQVAETSSSSGETAASDGFSGAMQDFLDN
jgi:L,D-transpeptidase YcbB